MAPRPDEDRRLARAFYLGYLGEREVLRYADRQTAVSALLAAVDALGSRHRSGDTVALLCESLGVSGRGVAVYGPWASRWADELEMHLGGDRLGYGTTVIDLRTADLWPWPFRVSEACPGMDRRGVALAPLAEVVHGTTGPVPLVGVVRAAPGKARPARMLTELMQRVSATTQPTGRVFETLAAVLGQARLVSGERRPERAVLRLLDGLRPGPGS